MPEDTRGQWTGWFFGGAVRPAVVSSWTSAERALWLEEMGAVDRAYWDELVPDGREAFMSAVPFHRAVMVARARRRLSHAVVGALADDAENPPDSVQGFWESGLMVAARPSRRRVWFERIMRGRVPGALDEVERSNQMKLEFPEAGDDSAE